MLENNNIENLDLSYQDNSIEIIGNNWESMGDESTMEILENFDSKENINYNAPR